MMLLEGEDAPLCTTCGNEMDWEDCTAPGCEDGSVSLYEDDPLFYDEDDYEPCDLCDGKGGWWYCPVCQSQAQRAAASVRVK